MKTLEVDVAIIGAGTAGMGAYRAARAYTDNIVLIEAGAYGTTCARVGCMPSKLLIAAAESAHSAKNTLPFGVHVGDVTIDGTEVLSRVRKERDRFVGFVLDSVEDFKAQHKIKGLAKFVDDHTLHVSEPGTPDKVATEIGAKRIVIATGSKPNPPPLFNAAGERLLINDDIFELHDLPKSMIVFGPGVIGLELGQALARLGVDVKMFGVGGGIGGIKDIEIKEYANAVFNEEFYLDSRAKVRQIKRVDNGVEVTYIHKSGDEKTETFDYLLAATGRKPNLDNLGIENTSIELNNKDVPHFNRFTMQTSAPHIFIAGDVNNDLTLLHEAADEGRIAGQNAGSYPVVHAIKRRTPLGVVFTDPQIASAGLTYANLQTQDEGYYATGVVSFENQGRSRIMRKNKGILKVYGEQGTGVFLGAEMIGPNAEHIMHTLSWAAQQKLTVSQMLEMPFYHPVVEEGVRTALRDLNAKLHIRYQLVENCLDCGPGA